jgi:hypothetical protein
MQTNYIDYRDRLSKNAQKKIYHKVTKKIKRLYLIGRAVLGINCIRPLNRKVVGWNPTLGMRTHLYFLCIVLCCVNICISSQRTSVDSYSQRCSWFTDFCHPDEGAATYL